MKIGEEKWTSKRKILCKLYIAKGDKVSCADLHSFIILTRIPMRPEAFLAKLFYFAHNLLLVPFFLYTSYFV